ncbi:MAG: BrxE family protein [Bdellovibrionales bacterium]|nr:BrxE family protein [Bdellovibrionales bacterium]
MVDCNRLLKLRLVVARFGEMDCAKWWNTRGVLGNVGKLAYSRGFPKTQVFARARAVFAVANQRSNEVFDAPDSFNLWKLPADIEDQFQEFLCNCLDSPEEWEEFVENLTCGPESDLMELLGSHGLIDEEVRTTAKELRRADDSRSVPLPKTSTANDRAVSLLAAAFSRGEPGKLAVPYVRFEGEEVNG